MEEPRLLTRTAVAGSCAGFVLIGMLQALYGPAIPAFRARFGVTPPVAGLALSAGFAGALAGVVVFHLLRSRLRDRTLLGASYVLMAGGAVLFAVSPAWPASLGAALLNGAGSGGIDYGLNRLFAVGFGRRSTAMLNLLNAYFGVGAVAGPALEGWIGARHYPWLFGAVAAGSLLAIPSLRGVGQEAPRAGQAGAGEAGQSGEIGEIGEDGATAGRRRPGPGVGRIVAAFIAVYVLYVAIETGVGGWEPTHLEAVGYPASVAATATAAFWLALTIGRFIAVPVTLRWPGPPIVIACCLGMAGFLLLAPVPAAAPYAYGALGLACAPIWATGLPWLARAAPSVAAASAYVMAASMVGGIAFPPLLGRAIELAGVRSVPLVLCALAVVCAALSLWLRRATVTAARATERGATERSSPGTASGGAAGGQANRRAGA